MSNPAPKPDPRDAVIERIVDLYRDARRGVMGGHTHWGKLIVTKLRTLADVDVSRLDDFEGDGEEAHKFADLVQKFVAGQDRRLAAYAALSERVPWYVLTESERAEDEAGFRYRAGIVVDAFVYQVSALTFEHAAPAPCTFANGCIWYDGDQLDVDGDFDGSDPLEPKPWRYQYVVEDYGWSHAMPDQKVTFKRKWGRFWVWARLDERADSGYRERRAVMNYGGEPRRILGWTIERTQLTGEAPCPRCNHGDERKVPEILRETCPFCEGTSYFHNDAQVVVYVRNK